MDLLDIKLLNDFQRRFPLVPRPYAALAETLGTSEEAVIAALERLRAGGAVSRVGAVFRPGAIGASTLAAMAVPRSRLQSVAAVVSALRQVNHNYEREHRYNLWFVAGAPDEQELAATLAAIEGATGIPVIALPLVEEYHIDLGFKMDGSEPRTQRPPQKPLRAALDERDRALVGALEDGLPFVERPYAAIGHRSDLTETAVLARIATWQANGLIRRFGVVVRHHELGYRANAMAIWDVPDEIAPGYGAALACIEGVTLAYRRARDPQWPYNVYCMVHGVDRGEVAARIAQAARATGLERFPHEVLFSRTRFKQTGARIASIPAEPAHG